MKNSIAKSVAFIGVMAALVFVVLTLETYVFIYFIKPSPAFFSIPIAISLSVFADWKKMFMGGTILGVCAFILSFIVGYTPFYNPLVSVLPRIIMGIVAFGVMAGMKSLLKNADSVFARDILPCALAGAAGVLTNTVLVLLMMFAFAGGDAFLETALATILSVNFLLEFVCSVLLVPVFVRTMRKVGGNFISIPAEKEKKETADREN